MKDKPMLLGMKEADAALEAARLVASSFTDSEPLCLTAPGQVAADRMIALKAALRALAFRLNRPSPRWSCNGCLASRVELVFDYAKGETLADAIASAACEWCGSHDVEALPYRWRVTLARGGGTLGHVEARSMEDAYPKAYALARERGADPGTVLLELDEPEAAGMDDGVRIVERGRQVFEFTAPDQVFGCSRAPAGVRELVFEVRADGCTIQGLPVVSRRRYIVPVLDDGTIEWKSMADEPLEVQS